MNRKWSYDGKWLTYAKGKDANQLELYRISDGKKVTPFRADAINYQWSPDRKWIHNIDEAANYYEKRDWEHVVSVQE